MTAKTGTHTAGARTRDQLKRRLTEIAGRIVAEVRITPALYGGGTVWCAMAISPSRQEIPLPGVARDVAALIQGAFPRADWSRAQDYDTATGLLSEHVVRIPACLSGDQR